MRNYVIQSVTASCLWTVGDLLAQRIENKHDHKRTMLMASYGLFIAGY